MQTLARIHDRFCGATELRVRSKLREGSAGQSEPRGQRGRSIGDLFLGIAVVASMLLAGASLAAASGDGEQTSLTGEVIDAACYLAHGRKGAGPGHRRCADECINKKNLPIGLLTPDDKVVLLVPDHGNEAPYEELKKHASETVTVEGKRVERGGLPAVIVSAVKKP